MSIKRKSIELSTIDSDFKDERVNKLADTGNEMKKPKTILQTPKQSIRRNNQFSTIHNARAARQSFYTSSKQGILKTCSKNRTASVKNLKDLATSTSRLTLSPGKKFIFSEQNLKLNLSSISSVSEDHDTYEDDNEIREIYCTYMSRKFQNKIITKDYEKKSQSAKICLVEWKNEYEQLLKLNTKLKNEIKQMETQENNIENLITFKRETKTIVDLIKSDKLKETLLILKNNFEEESKQVKLVNISKADVERVLLNGMLAPNSVFLNVLKEINRYLSKNADTTSRLNRAATEVLNLLEIRKHLSVISHATAVRTLTSTIDKLYDMASTSLNKISNDAPNTSGPCDASTPNSNCSPTSSS